MIMAKFELNANVDTKSVHAETWFASRKNMDYMFWQKHFLIPACCT